MSDGRRIVLTYIVAIDGEGGATVEEVRGLAEGRGLAELRDLIGGNLELGKCGDAYLEKVEEV